jgi:hypothetical protein
MKYVKSIVDIRHAIKTTSSASSHALQRWKIMHGGIVNQRICDSFLAYRGSKPMRDSLLASNL